MRTKMNLPFLIILIILFFTACPGTDLRYYDMYLLLLNDSLNVADLMITYPDSESAYEGRYGNSFAVKTNCLFLASVRRVYNYRGSSLGDWYPESSYWFKIANNSQQTLYGIFSCDLKFPNLTSEEASIFAKIPEYDEFTSDVLTTDEKTTLLNYIKRQIDAGNKWAAKSEAEQTELWVGDVP